MLTLVIQKSVHLWRHELNHKFEAHLISLNCALHYTMWLFRYSLFLRRFPLWTYVTVPTELAACMLPSIQHSRDASSRALACRQAREWVFKSLLTRTQAQNDCAVTDSNIIIFIHFLKLIIFFCTQISWLFFGTWRRFSHFFWWRHW